MRQRTENFLPSFVFTVSFAPALKSGDVMPSMSKISFPVRPSDSRLTPSSNCSGRTPMPTRLLRWILSNEVAITARTPRRSVPFAAQSRDEPVPYSAPARMTSGVFSC
jgi:hypothetical protein